MKQMLTVLKFTFRNWIRSKSFLITTMIIVASITVGINLPYLISKFSSDEAAKVGVFSQGSDHSITQGLDAYFKGQENPEILIVPLTDTGSEGGNEELGRQKINHGEIKGFLDFTEPSSSGFPQAVYKSESSMEFEIVESLRQGLQAVKTELVVRDLGLNAEQLQRLNAPVNLKTVQLSHAQTSGKNESQMAMSYILVYVMLFLLYMTVIGYGNAVATEITSEKSSRVMEVLISSVSPLKQMFGKILGICLVGLVQIGIIIAVAIANLALPHNASMISKWNLNLADIPLSLIGYFLLFYLLGYFVYATIYAAIGSLISRTEEVNQAVMPATFLIIAAFLIAMYGLRHPTSTIVIVLSHVPFFSSLLMFLRIGVTDVPGWEIAISVAISAASIGLLGYIAAKIYRVGVLMYGKRPSFRELRKAMKSFRF